MKAELSSSSKQLTLKAEAPVVMWKAAVNQEREVKTDGGRNDERAKRGAGWREEGASGENVVMAVQ